MISPFRQTSFTGPGGARDQDVRHLGQVGHLHGAFDVLAQADHHRVVVAEGDLRLEHVAQADDLLVHVRDLHPDRGLARDRGDDPHVGALDRVGDVLGQPGDRLHLDGRAEFDLVPGYRRAPAEPGDLRVHLELLEHLGQRGHHDVIGPGPRLRRRPRPQQRGGRQRVGDRVAAGQHELLRAAQRRRRLGHGHRLMRGVRGRRGRAGVLVPAEAERLDQAVAAVRAGRAGGELARALLVLLDQRRVVGLGVLARLDGRAEPDLPGDLAAGPAYRAAGAGLVVLVDLQAVIVTFGVRPAVPEQLAQLGEAFRYPVHRGTGDEQEAIQRQQRQQRRRRPRRDGGGEWPGHHVAHVAAGRTHRVLAVGRPRRALGHVDQAGRAEQQRGPADGRADRLGVAVRVSQEPPGQQHREHRYHPGEGAEAVGRRSADGPPDRVAHPAPQRGGEHDGHAQGEQPHAVPAVVRVQVARAAADGPSREADRAGRHHPGGRDRAAGPPDQDHDRIARGPALGWPALAGAALGRAPLRRPRLGGRAFLLLRRTSLSTPPRLAARAARGGRPGGGLAACRRRSAAAGGTGPARGTAVRARAGPAVVLRGFQQFEGILG